MTPIVTYKTKTEQLVNPATNTKANVYFALQVWHKFEDGYKAEFKYYYLEDEQEVLISYLGLQRELTNEEVNLLASTITPIATSYVERENEFLAAGSLDIIGNDGHFGLTKSDWELV